MREVKKLVRWSHVGQGLVEQQIAKSIKPGEISEISFFEAQKIVDWKKEIDTFAKHIPDKLEKVVGKVHIYYNYHSSSGYKTNILQDAAGEFHVEITKPTGGVLCAFWSEVIIFI